MLRAGAGCRRASSKESGKARQAIDLRLDMRNALIALGALGAMFDHLCEAERLAASLDDHRRLGWVSAYLSNYFCNTGDQDRAVETGQRALAIAIASKDFALEVMATFFLGVLYISLGDYRQAVHYYRKNVESLTDEWLHERFGRPVCLPSSPMPFLTGALPRSENLPRALSAGKRRSRSPRRRLINPSP